MCSQVIWAIMGLHTVIQTLTVSGYHGNWSARRETGALGTPVSVRRRMKDWENDGNWSWEVLVRNGEGEGRPTCCCLGEGRWQTHSGEKRTRKCLMWHHCALTADLWLSKCLDVKKLHPPALSSTLHSLLSPMAKHDPVGSSFVVQLYQCIMYNMSLGLLSDFRLSPINSCNFLLNQYSPVTLNSSDSEWWFLFIWVFVWSVWVSVG